LHYFGRDSEYWKNLTEEKVEALVTLQNEKEKEYWETWIAIIKKVLS